MKNLKIINQKELKDWAKEIFKKNSFNMVDVSSKKETFRRALASGKIFVGKEVFVGSNTALIAPLNIGHKVTIGAGSVITQNIKTKSLAITRVKQREIKNWTAKNKKG